MIKEWLMENGSYKIVALLITLILWVTVLGSKDLNIYKSVKLDVQLPEELIVANPVADQVQLQISGSRLSLKKIHKGLQPITINLKDAKPGRTVVPIPSEDIGLPFGSKILSVTPSSLVLDIDRMTVKWLPIRVDWVSEESPINTVRVINIKPTGVQVRGASSVLNRLDAVWTEPINLKQIMLDGSRRSVEIRTQIKDLNFAGVLPVEDKNVTVTASAR